MVVVSSVNLFAGGDKCCWPKAAFRKGKDDVGQQG